MEYIKINKLITKSIYKQIAASITEAIKKGILSYNDKMPTEKEICQMFGISQTTVKRAYDELIQDGLIKRIKGKGTYVTNREMYKTDLHSFYEMEILEDKSIERLKKSVILLDRTNKDIGARRELKLSSNQKYYMIVNLYTSDGNPKLLQRIYLPKHYYPSFDSTYSEDQNIFELLEKSYHYSIQHFHSTFSAMNVSKSDALLLQIEPDEAISLVRTKVVDDNDNIIGYICNYYPGTYTEFEVQVHAI